MCFYQKFISVKLFFKLLDFLIQSKQPADNKLCEVLCLARVRTNITNLYLVAVFDRLIINKFYHVFAGTSSNYVTFRKYRERQYLVIYLRYVLDIPCLVLVVICK